MQPSCPLVGRVGGRAMRSSGRYTMVAMAVSTKNARRTSSSHFEVGRLIRPGTLIRGTSAACAAVPAVSSRRNPHLHDPFPSTGNRTARIEARKLESQWLESKLPLDLNAAPISYRKQASSAALQRTLFGASLFSIIPHFRRLLDPRHFERFRPSISRVSDPKPHAGCFNITAHVPVLDLLVPHNSESTKCTPFG